MGIRLFNVSCSKYDRKNDYNDPYGVIGDIGRNYSDASLLPLPNPLKYEIKRSVSYGNFVLLEVLYPDCTNYEGRKIMLYKDVTLKGLIKQKHLDPHFAENKQFCSPIARFEPTEYGWRIGVKIMKEMSEITV